MSQFPPSSPTGPQQAYPYGYPPQQQANPLDVLLAPARRAGIMMFVVAILGLLFGGCFLLLFVAANMPEVRSTPDFQRIITQSGGTFELLRGMMLVIGALFAMGAVAIGVLGFFVRRGNMPTVIAGMVVTIIAILIFALWLLAGLAQGQFPILCFCGLPLTLLTFQLVWLFQAVSRAGQVKQWRDYFAQAAAHQQHAAYGYTQPPQAYSPTQYPPPPPPPAAP